MLDLDTTGLETIAARKLTPHDNCKVKDLDRDGVGATVFPRNIDVEVSGVDGGRVTAIWDGTIGLAIDDLVVCHEYGEMTAWRVASAGGDKPGEVRVTKLYESDFGAVAMETDAAGNVTLNGTRTLTIPTDMIHAGDPDTLLRFTTDVVEFLVGNLSMLKLTEAAQDLIEFGPGSGDMDMNWNGDMFLQGSTGNFGVGINPPVAKFDVFAGLTDALPYRLLRRVAATTGGQNIAQLRAESTGTAAATFGASLLFGADNAAGSLADRSEITGGFDGTSNNGFLLFRTKTAGNVMTDRMAIKGNGDVSIGLALTVSPGAQLDVKQGAGGANQPVLKLDQLDVSEQCIKFSSNSVDQDINLYTVDVTGTPTMKWDESADGVNWSKGLTIQGALETEGKRIIAFQVLTTTGSVSASVQGVKLNSATAKTATLPAIVEGTVLMFSNVGVGTWTLDTPGSELVTGSASITLTTGEQLTVWADDVPNWI